MIQPPLPPQVDQSVGDPVAGPGQGGGPGPTAPTKTMDELERELGLRFAKDPAGIQVEKRQGGFAITLKGAVLFDSASAELSATSRPYLDSIAQSLRATPYRVTVEGHTDNMPIQSFLYPSNWELSAARASRVSARRHHARRHRVDCRHRDARQRYPAALQPDDPADDQWLGLVCVAEHVWRR